MQKHYLQDKSPEQSEERKKLEAWLNKSMRIRMTDGRTLIGKYNQQLHLTKGTL